MLRYVATYEDGRSATKQVSSAELRDYVPRWL